MKRKRDGLVPIGDALADLDGSVKAIREVSPQARHHFTSFDQVNQLVSVGEADPDLGHRGRHDLLVHPGAADVLHPPRFRSGGR